MASIGIAAAALEVMVRSEAVTGKDPPVPGYVEWLYIDCGALELDFANFVANFE